ncbi:hypothetical protein BDF20DRAFT_835457 [Mycotypha africana]|uniref:uncharacterized protein n=1 Tax=Mycotypha africana TaxID=64632 RepID=UPI002301995F|nr:uncharacterized protein BDF20DRAFT_835457 [Mycotypha africana]KAI8979435.1 hypothetical protein BDF20DRAFT_835457 [Mycotypha africana]
MVNREEAMWNFWFSMLKDQNFLTLLLLPLLLSLNQSRSIDEIITQDRTAHTAFASDEGAEGEEGGDDQLVCFDAVTTIKAIKPTINSIPPINVTLWFITENVDNSNLRVFIPNMKNNRTLWMRNCIVP